MASSIQATVACSVHKAGPSVHTASTVTTRTGRLGWLKKITRLFVRWNNLEISTKGKNLPEAGLKNGCMVVERIKQLGSAFVTLAAPLVERWRVSRRSEEAALWRNPAVGFDQPDQPTNQTHQF